MFPSDMVTQLYPQARGSLFIAFCDEQGCCGGIVTPLHTGTFGHSGPLSSGIVIFLFICGIVPLALLIE
jgi:hypothetical protein